MAKPAPRQLTVVNIADITPHMRRITFGGSDIETLPANHESAHLKLIFPQTASKKGSSRPAKRSYTIVNQRRHQIDIDFVLHAPNHKGVEGPASQWVKTVQVGDALQATGPSSTKLVAPYADWYLLTGDMTALPSISVNLARLPKDAQGYAVIEVMSEQDIRPLIKPDSIDVHWVIVPHASATQTPLYDKIKQLPWLAGIPEVWVACEFNTMRALRKWLKKKDVPKANRYISSYWKIDRSDDKHNKAKRRDELQAS